MKRRYVDLSSPLVNKALLGIIRPDVPGLMLYFEMTYFAIVYVLFYFYGISNPLFVFSLNLRPLLGFDMVHTSVGLFTCVGINTSVVCPAGTSDYRWAVASSYFSAFLEPKLSVTYFLISLTIADTLLPKVRGPFSQLVSSLRKIKTYS